MGKKQLGIMTFLAMVFVLLTGTKAAYSKTAKGSLEYDFSYSAWDFDDDGVDDFLMPSSEYVEDTIHITSPAWLIYEFKEGYVENSSDLSILKITSEETDIYFNRLILFNDVVGKKGKIKLLPGTYRIIPGVRGTGTDLSKAGTAGHAIFEYQLKDASFKSVTYSCTYAPIGGEYYLIEKNGELVKAKYKCNKKNKIEVTNDGRLKIVGYGKFTVTAKAGGYTMKIKFNTDKPDYSPRSFTLCYEGLSEGVRYQFTYDDFKNVDKNAKIKYKSSNPKVGIITESGVFDALKPGKTTITATIEGIKVKFDIQVDANEFHNEDMKTDFRNLEDGGFYTRDLMARFNSDGSISYSAYIINKNKETMDLDWIRLEFYNSSGELIAKQKFENRKEKIDYGDFAKIDFKIDKENVYSTAINFYNGSFDVQWYVSWR